MEFKIEIYSSDIIRVQPRILIGNTFRYQCTPIAFKRLMFLKGIDYINIVESRFNNWADYRLDLPTYQEFIEFHNILKREDKTNYWSIGCMEHTFLTEIQKRFTED